MKNSNLKRISLDEAKKLELKILLYLDDVCRQLNIEYFLAYGSLLGAIRHKGFIPWDDDIDVLLFHKDYDKLINYLYNNSTNKRYKIITSSSEGYYIPFPKLIDTRTRIQEPNVPAIPGYGLYVDIFPLDSIPENIFFRQAYFKFIKVLDKSRELSIQDASKIKITNLKHLIKTVAVSLLSKIGSKFFIELMDLSRNIINRFESSLCRCGYSFNNKPYKKEWFDRTFYHSFEQYSFKIPVGYDNVLFTEYGDYMLLPDKDSRVTHNYNFILYKEND